MNLNELHDNRTGCWRDLLFAGIAVRQSDSKAIFTLCFQNRTSYARARSLVKRNSAGSILIKKVDEEQPLESRPH